MATPTLPAIRIPAVDPSDADLLTMLASLLAAMPGPRVRAPLSQVIEYVCATCDLDGAAERALRLESELAEYLAEWRVLRSAQASPAGLDAWASETPIVFLRAALVGCARCQRAGGDAR